MISKIKEYSVLNKSLTTQIDELEVTNLLFRKFKKSGLRFGLKKPKRKLGELLTRFRNPMNALFQIVIRTMDQMYL